MPISFVEISRRENAGMEVGAIPNIRLVPTDNATRPDRELSGVFATEFRKQEEEHQGGSKHQRARQDELPEDQVVLETESAGTDPSINDAAPSDEPDSSPGINVFA